MHVLFKLNSKRLHLQVVLKKAIAVILLSALMLDYKHVTMSTENNSAVAASLGAEVVSPEGDGFRKAVAFNVGLYKRVKDREAAAEQ